MLYTVSVHLYKYVTMLSVKNTGFKHLIFLQCYFVSITQCKHNLRLVCTRNKCIYAKKQIYQRLKPEETLSKFLYQPKRFHHLTLLISGGDCFTEKLL